MYVCMYVCTHSYVCMVRANADDFMSKKNNFAPIKNTNIQNKSKNQINQPDFIFIKYGNDVIGLIIYFKTTKATMSSITLLLIL